MIRIELARSADGHVVSFRVRGHSGWAERGSDIVCAGVAALTQAAVLGLVHHVGAPVQTAADEGFLECELGPGEPGVAARETQAILATMVLGLREIAAQYPEHVTMVERTVSR